MLLQKISIISSISALASVNEPLLLLLLLFLLMRLIVDKKYDEGNTTQSKKGSWPTAEEKNVDKSYIIQNMVENVSNSFFINFFFCSLLVGVVNKKWYSCFKLYLYQSVIFPIWAPFSNFIEIGWKI